MNKAQLRQTLYRCQPDAMERVAGYEVYAADCTEDPHPEADTLPDRQVLRIEFLRADGAPRYKRPLYLFWIGPTTVPLPELCRMYLWRFAIEHMFRFLKQPQAPTTPSGCQKGQKQAQKALIGGFGYTIQLLMYEATGFCPIRSPYPQPSFDGWGLNSRTSGGTMNLV